MYFLSSAYGLGEAMLKKLAAKLSLVWEISINCIEYTNFYRIIINDKKRLVRLTAQSHKASTNVHWNEFSAGKLDTNAKQSDSINFFLSKNSLFICILMLTL